jgi:phospholipid/cholesterol/gamma-HCH transport system substrate-binding protein
MFGRKKHKVDKLPLERRSRKFPLWGIGIIALLVIAGLFTLGLKRHQIQTALASGRTIQAQFDRNDLLLPAQTTVKVAGVPIGVVSGVKQDAKGALVSMKIFGNNAEQLGANPSAALRISTLLGGINYVQLTPGTKPGTPRGVITNTTTPVYVDSLLSAVPPDAQQGAKKFITQFDSTFAQGGQQDTRQLLANAPGALRPSAGVLTSFEGNEPGDLTNLVAYLEATDATVTAQQGQIEQIVNGLGSFSNTLGNNAQALQQLSATLPSDLSTTRSGLATLDTTLTEVQQTAALAQPSVQQLGRLIDESQPTLLLANPVLGELQPFLTNAAPLLTQLVPTSELSTNLLNELNGPVLNRTINTIEPGLNKEQNVTDERGLGSAGPPTLYAAIADTASGLDGVASYFDGFAHYTPVIGGADQNSVVPSQSPRGSAAGEKTDVCANGPTPTANQGLGPCPGASGTGDDLPGNATQGGPDVTPKAVVPPGNS